MSDTIARGLSKNNSDKIGLLINLQTTEKGSLVDAVNETTAQLAETMKELVNVEKYGAVADGITDSTEAIKLAIANGDIIYFPNKHYKVTDELVFKHGQTIFAPKGVLLDGTNFIGTNGNNVVKVMNDSTDYTALPSISLDLVKGDHQITFTTAHNLSVGDIICLYDNADSSWSSARTYYKKSEFCKVASIVSTTVVLLDSPIFDSYDASTNVNFGCYKMNMGMFDVYGKLEIIQGKAGDYYGISIERVKDFNLSNIIAYAKNGSYASVNLYQCYNGEFIGTALQEKLSGLGGDYGLAISNCQHIKGDGYFLGARHGVTTGGNDGIGCVINRDIEIKGTVKTLGNAQALGLHGNTELFIFDGVCYGAMAIAGANTKIKGTVYADDTGNCVQFSEVKSFSHDLSGLTCISKGNPSPRGIIDFGGTTAAEVNNMLGGTLDLSRVKINAPNATVGIVVRTRNTVVSSEERNVDVSFAKIKNINAVGSLSYNIRDTSAMKNFSRVDATGVIFSAENRTVLNTDIYFAEALKGVLFFTTNTSVNFIDVPVTFSKPYASGYVPSISSNLRIGTIGTTKVLCSVVAATETGFTARVFTLDGTNFSASVTNNVYWIAS